MKAIMVMFDSLNRRFLQPYGSKETITPNFQRLAERTVQFNNCYAGSLPCIPARRELHTGRYNFLHRSWGPLEPFDDSMPRMLKDNGIHSHLVSDHGHYWECGGATYHTQYSTWDIIRGQEGDMWQAVVGGAEDKEPNFVQFTDSVRKVLYQQNLANRTVVREGSDFPLVRTFDAGLDFLKKNVDKDSWFLQIESFAPHEPFFADEKFKKMYPCKNVGKRYEWPDYAPVSETGEVIEQVKYAYFASLSMCDDQLGRILDFMDDYHMWEDTMLIVNTDHGFMLGEHGYWAKNYMPGYDEIVHIPLFIWDPRYPICHGIQRESLVQTIDLPLTVLSFFHVEAGKDMQGISLERVLAADEKVHEGILFGMFGGHICYTDGRYIYMRMPKNFNVPLYEYTLMPTHMMSFFTTEELATMERADSFSFTKGLPVMRIETGNKMRCIEQRNLLFDMVEDPKQQHSMLSDIDESMSLQRKGSDSIERLRIRLEREMRLLLEKSDIPESLKKRFGF